MHASSHFDREYGNHEKHFTCLDCNTKRRDMQTQRISARAKDRCEAGRSVLPAHDGAFDAYCDLEDAITFEAQRSRAAHAAAGGDSGCVAGASSDADGEALAPMPAAPEDGTVCEDGSTAWAVKCFDPTTMKADATVLMLGKRGTGKSTLLQDIMYHMQSRLFAGIAMAPTEDSVAMFEGFLPRCFVFDDFRANAVERLMQTKRLLSRMNRKKTKQAEAKGNEFERRYVAVLLDDCMYDKKNLKHTAVRDIFMNGRHEDVFFINLQQYVMDMGPDMRNNVDYVFAMRDTSMENRIKLWKTFFGMFSDYSDFSELFDSCTENYECLVLFNRASSNDWRDCIFWYKAAPSVPQFRIGHPVMWYLNYKFGVLPCDADAENEAMIKNAVSRTFYATLGRGGEDDEPGGADDRADEDAGGGGSAGKSAKGKRELRERVEKATQLMAKQDMDKQAMQQARKKKVVKVGLLPNIKAISDARAAVATAASAPKPPRQPVRRPAAGTAAAERSSAAPSAKRAPAQPPPAQRPHRPQMGKRTFASHAVHSMLLDADSPHADAPQPRR